MKSTDFIKLLCIVESIFQTAIAGGHNILVLTPFGNTEDNVPQEDMVKIYNSCIFKYGHRFNKIIIAVPIWHGTYIYDLFANEIVRPQTFSDEEESENNMKVMKKISNKKKSSKLEL